MPSDAQESRHNLGAIILYFCISAALIYLWAFADVTRSSFNGYHKAYVIDMVYGEAYRPYVTRALIPMATRAVTGVLPAKCTQSFNTFVQENHTLSDIFEEHRWEGSSFI